MNPRDVQAHLAGKNFVVNADGQLLRRLTLPSPGVPNLAFSPDEKTVYVTALDQVDKPPYHGKLYTIPNNLRTTSGRLTPMSRLLAAKTAVITSSSSGIGRAIAITFTAEGA